jgi:hypothetical protein
VAAVTTTGAPAAPANARTAAAVVSRVESWWFPPIALGRVAALRLLAYLFIPVDVILTTSWIAEHKYVPTDWFRPVRLARIVHLPAPTYDGVTTVRALLLAAAVVAAVLAIAGAGRALRVAGVVVAVLYLWWMLIGQSYGKVDHDRFAFVLMLFVLPTVGAARLGDRTSSERAGWAVRMVQIGVVATYFLAAWAKIRFGGWGWVNGATLTSAVLRRGTGWAQWTLDAPGFLRAFQWFMVAFELGSIVLLFITRKRLLYTLVGMLVAFHVMTFMMLRIIFLPHLVALMSFLPLELLWARPGRRRATSGTSGEELADHRLGEPQPLVEPLLVGQEALAVGPHQLHDVERGLAVPGAGGVEQGRPVGELDRREHATQPVVEQAHQFDTEGDLGAAPQHVGDEGQQPV